jgi:4-aminobutyrate aminotransferase-like enzyme
VLDVGSLQERRLRLLGPGLRQFYDFPFVPVRASGVWIEDIEGGRYLDAYNNVPHVGHGNPRVVEALSRQAALLNSNTRYLHPLILDYAEALTATLPDGLDVCVMVCTGSEANDLAWRLASTFSGNGGALVTSVAYHGNTSFLSTLDGWRGRKAPPSNVATIPPSALTEEPLFETAIAGAIGELESRGHKLAAAFFDTAFANEGLKQPAPGAVREAVRRIHAAGGLYVADEVQAGLGRLGDVMWGFQGLGATPDIVTMGKPLGNGHPLGAVVTRREILEAFTARERYFNTFGGNPVSCAAGLAVLNVLRDDSLQEHAARTGKVLHQMLRSLADRHPAIADVRGRGLFQGAVIRDPGTGEVSPALARIIMNAVAKAGVLVGITGPERAMLKIRPPMPFDDANAARLAETLDRVLQTACD